MLHFHFWEIPMLWWPGIVAVLVIAFWFLFLIKFGSAVQMILHAYAISYERKHRIIAKVIGRGTDYGLLISIIYVIGAIAYYTIKFRE